MRNKERKAAFLLCMLLSTGAIGGCGQEEVEKVAEDVAIVQAANPTVGSLKLSGEFIATIMPEDSVYVIPKTTAEVLEVNVKVGDVVEEGQLLAVLDDTLAQINMKSAQIGLDNSKRAYNLSYGDGASALNDMQTDNTLTQAEDGVNTLQESLVDAMDAKAQCEKKLKDTQADYDEHKRKYDYNEDVSEILDYAETLDRQSPEYMAAMMRYAEAQNIDQQYQSGISQLKSALDECESTIETLQDNIDSTYDSYRQAVTSTNISNGELLEEQKKVSQNNIKSAQLNIEQLKESLKAYQITAPIGGTVEAVNVDVHDFAASSNPAFVISNKNAMIATYYVSEDVRNTLSIGQKISLSKDDILYDGEIIEIGSAIDTTTGLFMIKASVKGDTAGLLSGTKATVTSDTYHEDNALIIPYDAVYYEGSQAYVYTVVDGKAAKKSVTTGLYDVENIVISEGLTENDLIITTWAAQLREGVDVSVVDDTAQEKTQE